MMTAILVNAGLMLLAAVTLWAVSAVIRDVSIVDIFWGLGFVLVAWSTYMQSTPAPPEALWLTLIVSIWGLRLAGYLAWRNWGKEEDYRYRAMRDHHGKRFVWVSLGTVFLLQAALLWFIALPIQCGIAAPRPWDGMAWLGLSLWLVGWLFESVGDWQLARFKADPANQGKVMRTGLWRYTRHPNYFGDFLVWWGFFLLGGRSAWWTILSPLLMSWLLIRVSGVRLLEKSLRSSKEGYEDYVRNTSAFFPWPPRRSDARQL